MGAIFICKIFENTTMQLDNKEFVKHIWFVNDNKFALCIFNYLAYNWEISNHLAASSFLKLLKYYIL